MSAEFTTIPAVKAVKAMATELQTVPQSTIPIPHRKHIIERKDCRKDCWSKEYERKVRIYKTLVEVHSMWSRGLSRKLQSGRLLAHTEDTKLLRGRPELTVTKDR